MRLILFRHGPAGTRDPLRWPDDRLRPLTEKGADRTIEACAGLLRLEPGIDLVLTSPLRRARQTAEHLARACETCGDLHAEDALAPGGSWRDALAALESIDESGTVVLVGHEPDLGKLAGVLLFGAPAGLPLKKAGACAIDFEGRPASGKGTLRWFLPPRALRRLAGRRSRV